MQRRLVVQVVAHDSRRVVQEVGYLIVVLAVGDDLLEQVDIIPAAGFDQLLLDGGTLFFWGGRSTLVLIARSM